MDIEHKINLLRKILILWYNVNHHREYHDILGEYWTINIGTAERCPMLNNLIRIELNFTEGKMPTADEMIQMNKYYRLCLISPRVEEYLKNDKKN